MPHVFFALAKFLTHPRTFSVVVTIALAGQENQPNASSFKYNEPNYYGYAWIIVSPLEDGIFVENVRAFYSSTYSYRWDWITFNYSRIISNFGHWKWPPPRLHRLVRHHREYWDSIMREPIVTVVVIVEAGSQGRPWGLRVGVKGYKGYYTAGHWDLEISTASVLPFATPPCTVDT